MNDIETTLRAMEERCEAATPPPWGFTVDSKTHKPAWLYSGHEGEESDLAEFEEWDGHYADQMQANVDFIVASRTDIPRLIAAVRVLLNGIETIGLLGVPKGSPADVNFAVEVFQDAESALTGNSETTGTESNDAN
jgi:hypothetical protein